MITKGKLAVALASVGMAGAAFFSAAAGAADATVDPSVVCTENCGGDSRPGEAGLTEALTATESNPTASDSTGALVVVDVLSFRPGHQKPGKLPHGT
jgi:hypothetical protein